MGTSNIVIAHTTKEYLITSKEPLTVELEPGTEVYYPLYSHHITGNYFMLFRDTVINKWHAIKEHRIDTEVFEIECTKPVPTEHYQKIFNLIYDGNFVSSSINVLEPYVEFILPYAFNHIPYVFSEMQNYNNKVTYLLSRKVVDFDKYCLVNFREEKVLNSDGKINNFTTKFRAVKSRTQTYVRWAKLINDTSSEYKNFEICPVLKFIDIYCAKIFADHILYCKRIEFY